MSSIHLGFELGTGYAVGIPADRHLAITGQTQISGKTTTLEALVARGGGRALAFVTKRGEASFRIAKPIAPYFRERTDWQFVQSLLEATMQQRLRFETSWIIRASEGARTLAEVHENVRKYLHGVRSVRQSRKRGSSEPRWDIKPAHGLSESVYRCLDAYFELVLPQLEKMPYTKTLELRPGLNVMDLTDYPMPVQALAIRSGIEWIYHKEKNVRVIIPEAWEFIPQDRGSPVRMAAEELIRKGATNQNFVWIDSQDLAGVHKVILRSVGVWIVGVQRESNEITRTLKQFISKPARPSPDDIMTLGRGQFFVCHGTECKRVYVQPEWVGEVHARAIARGEEPVESARKILREVEQEEAHRVEAETPVSAEPGPRGVAADPLPPLSDLILENEAAANAAEEEPMWKEKYKALEKDYNQLCNAHDALAAQVSALQGKKMFSPEVRPASSPGPNGTPDLETIYEYVRHRAGSDPDLLRVLTRRPELEVKIERVTLEADHSKLRGRLAVLISKKFFDEARTGSAAYDELVRLGFRCSKPGVYKELDALAGLGFVTNEKGTGYRTVPSMKVRIVEA